MTDRLAVEVSKYIDPKSGELRFVPADILAGYQEGVVGLMAAFPEVVNIVLDQMRKGHRWACELVFAKNEEFARITAKALGLGDPLDSWQTALKNAQTSQLEKVLSQAFGQSDPLGSPTPPNGSSFPLGTSPGSSPVAEPAHGPGPADTAGNPAPRASAADTLEAPAPSAGP